MITGGVDGLCELTLAGFNALHVVDASACRPFDRARGGLNLGEGAGVLVLESEESAVARGARVRGEVLGYAVTSDAHHMTAPHPDGAGAARAIAGALAAAGVRPEDVDCINAHGTGTPHNDVAETRAIRAVFGGLADRIPVCATKSLIGHALGAAGGLEAIAALHAIAENFIHPTLRLTDPDPECDLRHVIGDGLAARVDVVLSNSFGFGGNNCALVLGRAR
jgi:3-oxoacyl-[acyl-carrier-protein] synthase II